METNKIDAEIYLEANKMINDLMADTNQQREKLHVLQRLLNRAVAVDADTYLEPALSAEAVRLKEAVYYNDGDKKRREKRLDDVQQFELAEQIVKLLDKHAHMTGRR